MDGARSAHALIEPIEAAQPSDTVGCEGSGRGGAGRAVGLAVGVLLVALTVLAALFVLLFTRAPPYLAGPPRNQARA